MLVPLSPSAALFILLFYQNKVLGLPKSSSELKNLAVDYVETDAKMIQQMVDMIFSFGGLGFQEIETSRYLVDILKKNRVKGSRGNLRDAHCIFTALVG